MDAKNPKAAEEREKLTKAMKPIKKDYSIMTPDIMASFHRIQDVNMILGPIVSAQRVKKNA